MWWDYKAQTDAALLESMDKKLDSVLTRLWFIQRRALRMSKKLNSLLKMEVIEMATWAQVLNSVSRQETVTESVNTFIKGIKEELERIKSTATGPTEADLQVLVDRLEADANKAVEAITVNTDVEDEEVPEAPVEEPKPEEEPKVE